MPDTYRIYHQRFQDFSVNSSDVWVVTYPKAGKNVRLNMKLHFYLLLHTKVKKDYELHDEIWTIMHDVFR